MKASRLILEVPYMVGLLAICVLCILAEMGLVHPVWFFASIPTPLLLLLPAWMVLPRLEKREILEACREFDRRHRPLRDIVDEHRRMEGSEETYRQQLVRSLILRISTSARPEAPLPTGTRVDIALEYGGDDWFITIKKGLNNQKRLVLQGEIEDILRHAPRKGRDLWVVVVIGVEVSLDPTELAHLHRLLTFARERSVRKADERPGSSYVQVWPVFFRPDASTGNLSTT